jgi:hypothetical protein
VGRFSSAVAVALLLFASGCAESILQRPASASAGAWNIATKDVLDGANAYSTGTTTFEPQDGQRFLWVEVELTNTSPQKRRFNWDRCDLDDGADAYLPGVVVERTGLGSAPVAGVEILAPGDKLDRWLIFSYPEKKWPTRLKCGDVVVPLALASGK